MRKQDLIESRAFQEAGDEAKFFFLAASLSRKQTSRYPSLNSANRISRKRSYLFRQERKSDNEKGVAIE